MEKAIVTVHVIDTETVSVYLREHAHCDVVVVAVPADMQVLISTVSDGFLPTSISFFAHHVTGEYLIDDLFCLWMHFRCCGRRQHLASAHEKEVRSFDYCV